MSTGHGALVSLTAALCGLAVPLGTSAQDLGKRAEGAEAACDTIAAIVKTVPGAKVVRKGDTTTSSDGRHRPTDHRHRESILSQRRRRTTSIRRLHRSPRP